MHDRVMTFTAKHSGTIVLVTILLALLVIGAAGEAVAHNLAGQPVPGCENEADAVGNNNPNCHG